MKKFSLIFLLIGVLIFLNIFIEGFRLEFWRNIELILGSFLLITGVFPHKRFFSGSVRINGKNMEKLFNEDEKELEETLEEVTDALNDEEVPEFVRKITKSTINFSTNKKKTRIRKIVKNFLFGVSSGILLIFSSLNLFNIQFSFGEIILVLIGTYLIATGISSFIPVRGNNKWKMD